MGDKSESRTMECSVKQTQSTSERQESREMLGLQQLKEEMGLLTETVMQTRRDQDRVDTILQHPQAPGHQLEAIVLELKAAVSLQSKFLTKPSADCKCPAEPWPGQGVTPLSATLGTEAAATETYTEIEAKKLFVSNVSLGLDKIQLRDIFKGFGRIEKLYLRAPASGSKGSQNKTTTFAFITFESKDSVDFLVRGKVSSDQVYFIFAFKRFLSKCIKIT